MKSIFRGLMALLLFPAAVSGQVFKAPEFSSRQDFAILANEIHKHSPLMKSLIAEANKMQVDINEDQARDLVKQKLTEFDNSALNKMYQDITREDVARIGVVLYLMLNGPSNTEDYPGLDYKTAFGGGLGVYLMFTLAQLILMPELAFWIRPLKADYNGDEYRERYSYITLAITAMYVIRLQTINLLLGISPNFGYAISGKWKDNGDPWEDIEFDEDEVKRMNIGIALTAGIMLRNAMIIRLAYNFGLTKLYEYADDKMYAFMLALHIPFASLGGK